MKSTTVHGIVKQMISAIRYPTLIFLAGAPGTGFVLWQEVIFPPSIVAQESSVDTISSIKAIILIFFMVLIF